MLSTQSEWAGDRTLVQLVRMQLVIERMMVTVLYHDTMDVTSPLLPPSAYLHALHADLATVRAQYTPDDDAAGLSFEYRATE